MTSKSWPRDDVIRVGWFIQNGIFITNVRQLKVLLIHRKHAEFA